MIKPNLALLSIALLLFSPALFAQQKTVYSRMSGRMGGNIDVVGNFQRAGSTMEGNYSYNLYVDDSLLHLSHIIKLYGDIDKQNEVILKQLTDKDSIITGLFADHRFTGGWHGSDSAVLPFDLSENYPEGSMPMDVFYLHSDKELVTGAKGAPSAEIELTLLYPKKSIHIPLAVDDSVKKFIQEQFFGQFKSKQMPEALMNRTEKDFYNQFAELNNHWKTNHKMGFNFEKREQVSVIFNSYNLLCLQYKKRGYAGRGNPIEHFSYDLVDLRNGEKLTFNRIFKPGSETTLTALINNKIREDNGLSGSVSLKKIGFFTDSIPMSKNLSFSGNGISVIYNIYDIAPPSKGIIKVFLPFSKIGHYIKSTSVLYPLSR